MEFFLLFLSFSFLNNGNTKFKFEEFHRSLFLSRIGLPHSPTPTTIFHYYMDPMELADLRNEPQTLISEHHDSIMEEAGDSLLDSMLCDSSSKLIPSGFTRSENGGQSVYGF